MKRALVNLIALAQVVLGLRLVARLLRTSRGTRIRPTSSLYPPSIGVLVPVLDEAQRIVPCLERLIAFGPEVAEIVIVDGGSVDETPAIVAEYAARDKRIRLVETRPPDGINGKVHGLEVGLAELTARWVLTIDADVRPSAALPPALLRRAHAERLRILSVATEQWLGDRLDQFVHPSMLATLIYRFGIPGHATRRAAAVQANGQCMLIRRDLLDALGGFAPHARVIAEDVSLARAAARAGERVGFYETEGLVSVEMYRSGRETARNWSRSLPLPESRPFRNRLGDLANLLLLQAAPPYLFAAAARRRGFARAVNGALIATRIGILAGARRAYRNPDAWYWFSPLADLPVVALLIIRSAQRRHRWRGRVIHPGGGR